MPAQSDVLNLTIDEVGLLNVIRQVKASSGFGRLDGIIIKARKIVSVERTKENILI